MIYKHTEYTAYITWKTTFHFSTTLKVNSAHLSKYAWTSMNKSDTLRMLTESIYPIHCYSFPSKCHTREVKIFDFFYLSIFFKLTHQKFSFLHIKKTSCLCNSLIYRERGFLFWLHPGPNAWLRIKLPLSIIPLLWNLSFRFWMPVYFVYLSHNRSTKDPSIVPVSLGSPLETLICINFLLMTQIYTGRSKFLHSISLSCQQMSREILHLFLL